MVEVSGLQTDRAQMHVSEDNPTFVVIDSPSWDLPYVCDAASARLGKLRYFVKKDGGEVPHLLRVKVESTGTIEGRPFFGLPPIQSVMFPFALP